MMALNTSIERQNSNLSNDKSQKYDRQLRLWGNHGQSQLENSRVCLINASTVGTETLKNMVLPGVGYFTIIDDNLITEEDLSSKYYVFLNSNGLLVVSNNRAKVASEHLSELNPDVIVDHLNENVDRILENRPEYFKSFNLVVATNIKENTLQKLASYLWNENISFITIRSYGLVGYIRIISKEHKKSHPDNELPDLRLDQPFEELKSFCNSIDLQQISDTDHSHVPYLVLLFKYLEQWRCEKKNLLPKTYKEKEDLKELIRNGNLKNEELVPKFEENFDEALKNVNNSIHETKIPSDIKSLFEEEKCLNLNENSDEFWIILRAIREFTENEGGGLLPLRGTIPDMFSDSDKFISLQNVYKLKAQQDIESVMTRVERILLNINKPYDYINENLIKLYCKNAYNLKIIKYRSLKEEFDIQTSRIGALLEQNPDDDLIFYLLIRATEFFYCEYNRYPGTNSTATTMLDSDVNLLKKILSRMQNDQRISIPLKEEKKNELIQEICRFGNSEIHSVCAYLGGCAAHESIKLLTSQFIPCNNTLVYNAIKQTTAVYEL